MTEYPGGDRSPYTSFIVTIWYRPLEILFGHPDYGCKVDIWSFGCILTEMMIRKVLVREKHDISLIMVIPQLVGFLNESTRWSVSEIPNYNPFYPDF